MPTSSFKSREKYFRVILVLLPFLLFILLEIGLRVFHYGPNTDLFVPLKENPAYWQINPEMGMRYFPNFQIKPETSYDVILKRKPENGYRVFVLGGSSAFGYPYGRNGAFSKYLQEMLQDYLPERKVEVMNLAMCAVGSYTIRDIGLELMNYEPDAFLIYAGHNEFYGALGIGSSESLGSSRTWVNLYLRLRKYKIFQLVRDGVMKVKSLKSDNSAAPGKRLMEHLAGDQIIPYGSDLFYAAHENFVGNILDLVRAAEQQKIPVYLGDVVSNVRDQAPFRSVFAGENVSPDWNKLFESAKDMEQEENFSGALERLNVAQKMDSANADLFYLKARCLEKSGKILLAYENYYRAKDYDALRFRAAEELNQKIHNITYRNVVHVPVQKTFEHNSVNSLIGEPLMVDHLHPNLQGYFLLAKIYFQAMKNNVRFEAEEHRGTVQPDSVYWNNSGVTALDLAEADFRMQILLSSWPFTEGFASINDVRRDERNIVHQLAMQILKEEKTWEQAHVELAEYYIRAGRLNLAAQEYISLAKMTPYNVSPFLRLGQIFMQKRRFELALSYFQQSLDLEKTVLAFQGIGEACLHLSQPENGIPYLQSGLRLKNNDPLSLFLLARSYLKLGDRIRAKKTALQLKSVRADFPGLNSLLKKIN